MPWETISTVVMCFVISWVVSSNQVQALRNELTQWREKFGDGYSRLINRVNRLEGKD